MSIRELSVDEMSLVSGAGVYIPKLQEIGCNNFKTLMTVAESMAKDPKYRGQDWHYIAANSYITPDFSHAIDLMGASGSLTMEAWSKMYA